MINIIEVSGDAVADITESAYWQFDAMHKGYGEYKGMPLSERDAFKRIAQVLLSAGKGNAVPHRRVEDDAVVAAMIKAREIGVKMLSSDCEKLLCAAGYTEQVKLPCGHPSPLMLKIADTGEPLYCELCDTISRRNDAEARELELEDKVKRLVEALRGADEVFSLMYGVNHPPPLAVIKVAQLLAEIGGGV